MKTTITIALTILLSVLALPFMALAEGEDPMTGEGSIETSTDKPVVKPPTTTITTSK